MNKMVLGVFSDKDHAENAILALEEAEFDPKDMSIIMKNKEEAEELSESTGTHMAEGAASGAVTGGVVGGIAGLLIGIGAIAIPGIGALLIAGPIAAALGLTGAAATTVSGALTGALAGGLVGALTGLGVSEDDAKYYEERVKAGGILVVVPTLDMDEEDLARDIMETHGADQIRAVSSKSEARSSFVEERQPAYFSDIKKRRR